MGQKLFKEIIAQTSQIWCKNIQIHEFQQVQVGINKQQMMPRHIRV